MKSSLIAWFDTRHETDRPGELREIDWTRVAPFVALHLACLAAFWTGVSAIALWIALISYALRMFAITAGYHRYFAHRAFKTNRTMQFFLALIGSAATQRGPIWWAAWHRQHHVATDTHDDPHTPSKGAWWSHCGWFLSRQHFTAPYERVKDLNAFPELRWLDRFDTVVPILYAGGMFLLGYAIALYFPASGTSGWQMFTWGYVISTVALMHATLAVNSVCHRFGSRRFATRDNSRNNFWIALLTLGEGWHNNHHFSPGSARQGFTWWEIDLSYIVLCLLRSIGLVHDLKPAPVFNARATSSREAMS